MSEKMTNQLCAISFLGNASNGLQQDAFAINADWYQTKLGITEVMTQQKAFCVAVADGLAMSRHSGVASQAVVRSVAEQWQANQRVSIASIHDAVNALPKKYTGASSTLAMVTCQPDTHSQSTASVTITHVGDSRVYLHRKEAGQANGKMSQNGWRCLTRDHNVLNQLVQEQADEQGIPPNSTDFNREGMAGSLYALTECFTHADDVFAIDNPVPNADTQTLDIQAGDALLVCSDGIHDLVSSEAWQGISENTDLQDWLKTLKRQVYASEGKAYDNGTAVLVRF